MPPLPPVNKRILRREPATRKGFGIWDSSRPVRTHLGARRSSCPGNPGHFLAASGRAATSSHGLQLQGHSINSVFNFFVLSLS